MKRVILSLAIVTIALGANAQSGKNQLGIGPELGLSTESGGGTYIGGTAKYMHGVGTAGQVTLTAGYIAHSETNSGVKATASEIPILLGYRHYFTGVFVEPQLGYMSDRIKISAGNNSVSDSDGSFGYGIGGGYAFANGLDLGASYRNTTKSGSEGLIIFRVAYNISLGGK